MTPHNEAKKEDIAKIVLMPGDPLRAKYIAENFMENVRLVNQVRGMYAYTGTYKGKEITVMGHGMGIPSVGIYVHELFKFYDVECIIRIGSCGGYVESYNFIAVSNPNVIMFVNAVCLSSGVNSSGFTSESVTDNIQAAFLFRTFAIWNSASDSISAAIHPCFSYNSFKSAVAE